LFKSVNNRFVGNLHSERIPFLIEQPEIMDDDMPEAIETKLITTPSGESMGYLARPTSSGKHPAIVIQHGAFGMNDDIKDIAERYARLGFAAMALDLYLGKLLPTLEEGRAFAATIPDEEKFRRINSVADWLTSQDFADGPQFGITGFCMGGGLVLSIAARNPNVRVCAPFYPVVREDMQMLASKIKSPVLEFHGSDEHELAQKMQHAMNSHRRDFEVHVYEGARHGFFNRGQYHHVGAYDAWARVIPFFKKHLVRTPAGAR